MTIDHAPSLSQPVAVSRVSRLKKLAIAAGVFITLGVLYGLYYFFIAQYCEETDDAYVNANLIYVNAQMGGTVVALGADENQPVKTGQMLVRLDATDAAVALTDAQGRLGEVVRQVRQQFRSIDQAGAVVEQRKTDLAHAQGDLARRVQLAGGEVLSVEELAHAHEAATAAQNAHNVAEKQLAVVRALVSGTHVPYQPSVLRARAAYVQAYLATQRSEIRSPVDGFVARRTVQVGQRIAPGAALLAVVPLQSARVDANYKEPQLRYIRIGQPAKVRTDIYGGQVEYRGKVVSISAGSGGAFSLLPPQNATGNWIKVVQRVPVRIALDPNDLAAHPLRVGLSANVVIDTEQRDGAVDTALPLPNVALDTPVFAALLKIAERQADDIIARQLALTE
ncbi:MAG: HlyD family efflux transporter periplasmic adaptor subunit [Ottowia sp.]|nr:HlyD family efflux transporter periplasmic adaptor subunit [Ottowia sp.]